MTLRYFKVSIPENHLFLRFFLKLPISENYAAAAKSLQLCLTPCNPIDSSPPGSPALGILQARILEWVAISFFSEIFWNTLN